MVSELGFSEDGYAEAAALGAMLLNMNDCVEDAIDILGESADCFEDDKHGIVYSAMISLYRDGDPVDILTLNDRIVSQGAAKAFDKKLPSFLAGLYDVVPTSANFWYYAGIVQRRYVRREVLKTLTMAGGALNKNQMDEEEAMSLLEQRMYSLRQKREGNRPLPLHEILPSVVESVRQIRERKMEYFGILTGLFKLDAIMEGMKPGTLNILGARPSVGKTAVGINIAVNAAFQGHPVLFFSLEMSGTAIGQRIVSLTARTPLKELGGDFLPSVQQGKLTKAVLKLNEVPITVIDAPSLDVFRLRARARSFAAQCYPKMPLIVIDYLQLCCRSSDPRERRNEKVGEFTSECKQLAKELNCPILLLSQLNRTAEGLDNPFLAKSSLKDSGNIEEDTDTAVILLANLPDYLKKYCKDNGIPEENAVSAGLVKNRLGAVGMCPMCFEKNTQYVQTLYDYQPFYPPQKLPVQAEFNAGEDLV